MKSTNPAMRFAAITRDIAVFAMLGAILEAAKWALSWIVNVEIVSAIIIAYTLVYRARALIPLYVFIFLEGLSYGFFNVWFVMYLYVWLFLWGAVMLVSRKSRERTNVILLILISGLFGLSFGTLCSPPQAIFFGLDLKGTVAWIISGLPFDVIHAVGNCTTAALAVPLARALAMMERKNPFRRQLKQE